MIYLDPEHGTNAIRTLITSQMLAVTARLSTYTLLGPGYIAAGSALLITIVLMILVDAMHPPAVSTALSFVFRAGDASNFLLFGLALGITAILALLEQVTLRILAYYTKHAGL